MSLEDGIEDVVSKAMMGLGIDAGILAEKSGISVAELEEILSGVSKESSLRKIAAVLQLDADALVALPGYVPAVQDILGVRRIELPYRQWTVNAWMVEAGGLRLLFDTGFGSEDIIRSIENIMPDAVLITHSHEDHVGGMAALECDGIRVISETEALQESTFGFGSISVRAVDLSGHKTPTAGYLIEGLEKRLLVAGDAIFAGSIGRCRSTDAYRMAFANLRHVLGDARSDCVILPGHGPATTVAEEFDSNPFHMGFD